MKPGKLIRNVLLAVTGLVLLVLVALQVLLRPKVLTGIVNSLAAEYVDGAVSFRQVKAHVIKSFPHLEVEADDFCLTYPHQRFAAYDSLYPDAARRFSLLRAGQGRDSTHTDTLAALKQLRVSLDYMALLRRGEVHVRSLELVRPRIFAHAFDAQTANWHILSTGSGDSLSGKKPLPPILVRHIRLTDRPFIVYTQPADTLYGMFTLRRLALEGRFHTQEPDRLQGRLELDSLLVSGRLPADTVMLRLDALRLQAQDRAVEVQASAAARLATAGFGRLRVPLELQAQASFPERADSALAVDIQHLLLKVSSLPLEASGLVVRQPDCWDLDLEAGMEDGDIGSFIQEYKENFPFLKKLRTDARLTLVAQVNGRYGAGQTPSVEAAVQIPPAVVDYQGVGRKGRLALDAQVGTDDFKSVDATLDRLLVDVMGARLDASGSVKDLLGKDPLLALDGTLWARVDSLTRSFTQEAWGLYGTGRVEADLHGKARVSQLNAQKIGSAMVDGHLTLKDLALGMPADSLQAMIPHASLQLSTRANQMDRNLPKGARVLALQGQFDSLDVRQQSLLVQGGNVRLLLQNSAEILKGGQQLTPLMGLLDVGTLRLRDKDGLSLRLRDNRETFRISPATEQRPVPLLSLRSKSGALLMRRGSDLYALRDLNFDLSASRHVRKTSPTLPQERVRDTLRRRPSRPQDAFARADIQISLSKALRDYIRNWDFGGKLALKSGRLVMPAFPLRTRVEQVEGSFNNDTLRLQSLQLQAGASDVSASATVSGLRPVLLGSRRRPLKLKADVSSNFLDVNELMRAYAYSITYRPPAALEGASDEAVEQAVTRAQLPDSTGSQLLIIPANLDMQLSVESTGIRYDSLLVSWAAADIAMRQRTLQVTNAVAASNMGDIYFEGFYASRSKDDIQAGFDLNLVDITAEKVITLFPAVDSILPMLQSFAGNLDCELAATSAVDTNMNLVLPSIDGILKISGKDLRLRDSQEFSKIARMLMFKDREQAHIDNMSVAGIVRDNVLEVFPFVLDVDRYLLAASGIQQLDRKFNYHISVIRSPLLLKFGLNAWGPDFDDVHYWLSAPKYRSAQVPVYTKQLDTAQYNLIGAIHNIFEIGVEKAMAENRLQGLHADGLSLDPADASSTLPDSLRTTLEPLLDNVRSSTGNRREALREEVVRLEQAAARKNDPAVILPTAIQPTVILSEAKNL